MKKKKKSYLLDTGIQILSVLTVNGNTNLTEMVERRNKIKIIDPYLGGLIFLPRSLFSRKALLSLLDFLPCNQMKM
jgi:hypothetical protein